MATIRVAVCTNRRPDEVAECLVALALQGGGLGAMLVCREVGAVVVEGDARPLVTLDHGARRAPVAAATHALAEQLVAARARALAANRAAGVS